VALLILDSCITGTQKSWVQIAAENFGTEPYYEFWRSSVFYKELKTYVLKKNLHTGDSDVTTAISFPGARGLDSHFRGQQMFGTSMFTPVTSADFIVGINHRFLPSALAGIDRRLLL
jgi:hypothetical protein